MLWRLCISFDLEQGRKMGPRFHPPKGPGPLLSGRKFDLECLVKSSLKVTGFICFMI